tara:strand:- start:2739 stop:3806 length:1068 start_codon:yes stop_codon:yes gene_type:complete
MTKAAELAKMGEVLTNSQIGGRRNIAFNGAMQISQRGTSFTGIGNGDNAYFLDRFQFLEAGTPNGEFTITQASDGPAGFANSMKVDCTTAETALAANERIFIQQKIEGQNLQQLKKGTSSAEKVTLSFYVKSNLTGTAIVQFYDTNNSRTIAQSYTIDSANTWEKKTITFDGDTTGAFVNDNNVSVRLEFYLQAGSDFTSGTLPTTWQSFVTANTAVGQTINVASSTNNNFYLTGVQLEVGSVATPFEHRSFGEELALCQRYYEKGNIDTICTFITSNVLLGTVYFATTKRATPTIAYTTNFTLYVEGSTPSISGQTINGTADVTSFVPRATSSVSKSGKGAFIQNGDYTADSEL